MMKIRSKFKSIGIVLIWIAIWQWAAMAVGKTLLLPSPVDTAQRMIALAATPYFWTTAGMTLLRVMAGFLIGVIAGTLLGILTGLSKWAWDFFLPLSSIVRATPVTSFIVLVILWLSSGVTPVFAAFLMVMPIVWVSVREGILTVDKGLIEMATVFRLTRAQRVGAIYAPSMLPHYLASCTMGIGFAWKAGVAAEVIVTPAFSIGRSLYESKIYIETTDLFAWTAVIIILSLLLEKLIVRLFGGIKKW